MLSPTLPGSCLVWEPSVFVCVWGEAKGLSHTPQAQPHLLPRGRPHLTTPSPPVYSPISPDCPPGHATHPPITTPTSQLPPGHPDLSFLSTPSPSCLPDHLAHHFLTRVILL